MRFNDPEVSLLQKGSVSPQCFCRPTVMICHTADDLARLARLSHSDRTPSCDRYAHNLSRLRRDLLLNDAKVSESSISNLACKIVSGSYRLHPLCQESKTPTHTSRCHPVGWNMRHPVVLI